MIDIDQVVDNLDEDFVRSIERRHQNLDLSYATLLEFVRLAVAEALADALENQKVLCCYSCMDIFTLAELEEAQIPCFRCSEVVILEPIERTP